MRRIVLALSMIVLSVFLSSCGRDRKQMKVTTPPRETQWAGSFVTEPAVLETLRGQGFAHIVLTRGNRGVLMVTDRNFDKYAWTVNFKLSEVTAGGAQATCESAAAFYYQTTESRGRIAYSNRGGVEHHYGLNRAGVDRFRNESVLLNGQIPGAFLRCDNGKVKLKRTRVGGGEITLEATEGNATYRFLSSASRQFISVAANFPLASGEFTLRHMSPHQSGLDSSFLVQDIANEMLPPCPQTHRHYLLPAIGAERGTTVWNAARTGITLLWSRNSRQELANLGAGQRVGTLLRPRPVSARLKRADGTWLTGVVSLTGPDSGEIRFATTAPASEDETLQLEVEYLIPTQARAKIFFSQDITLRRNVVSALGAPLFRLLRD